MVQPPRLVPEPQGLPQAGVEERLQGEALRDGGHADGGHAAAEHGPQHRLRGTVSCSIAMYYK